MNTAAQAQHRGEGAEPGRPLQFNPGDRVRVINEHRYSLGSIQPTETGEVRSQGLVDFTHAVVSVKFRLADGSVVHASIRPENLQRIGR